MKTQSFIRSVVQFFQRLICYVRVHLVLHVGCKLKDEEEHKTQSDDPEIKE